MDSTAKASPSSPFPLSLPPLRCCCHFACNLSALRVCAELYCCLIQFATAVWVLCVYKCVCVCIGVCVGVCIDVCVCCLLFHVVFFSLTLSLSYLQPVACAPADGN